jgi:Zn ribbon nucleic-acid-binding protein
MEIAPHRIAGKKQWEIDNDDYECVECGYTHKELIYMMETDRSMPRTVTDNEINQIQQKSKPRGNVVFLPEKVLQKWEQEKEV